jgi:phosphatidate cytidylyltransferase
MMQLPSILTTTLMIVFGTGGLGIVVATGGSWQRLRHSVLSIRYLTWLALALVYSLAVTNGEIGAILLAAAMAGLGSREAAPLLRLHEPYRIILIACCSLLPLLLPFAGQWVVGATILVAIMVPIARGNVRELESAARLVFGILLIGWTLSHLVLLAQAGAAWLLLALLGTAISDVCAFLLGSVLRGPALTPRISPNKTWSGLLGNLLGALIALLMVWPLLPQLNSISAAMVIVIIGGGSCVGDLSESLLKRWAGVKDAGNWLPGFGGLLDRIDSLLVVTPVLAGFVALH